MCRILIIRRCIGPSRICLEGRVLRDLLQVRRRQIDILEAALAVEDRQTDSVRECSSATIH